MTGIRIISESISGVRVETHTQVAGDPDSLTPDRKFAAMAKVFVIVSVFDFAVGLFVYALYHHFFGD